MTGKKASTGWMITIPSPKSGVVVSGGSKGGKTKSFEIENTTKTLYKYHGGGCSSKMTQSHKAGGFVDKRNGNKGFKEEVIHKSTVKIDDKVAGRTTKYETQVKVKKVTINNSNSSKKARVAAAPKPTASYKRISYDYCEYY